MYYIDYENTVIDATMIILSYPSAVFHNSAISKKKILKKPITNDYGCDRFYRLLNMSSDLCCVPLDVSVFTGLKHYGTLYQRMPQMSKKEWSFLPKTWEKIAGYVL